MEGKVIENRGLRINRVKTEWMRCLFGEEDDDDEEIDLELDMQHQKEENFFKYLGSVIDSNGSMEREICELEKVCGSDVRQNNVDEAQEKSIRNCRQTSPFIYGAETWATTKREEERLNIN